MILLSVEKNVQYLVSPISGSVAIASRSQEMQCCGRIIKETQNQSITIRDVVKQENSSDLKLLILNID
jgi:hypothetical protein